MMSTSNIVILQGILGHSDIRITMRILLLILWRIEVLFNPLVSIDGGKKATQDHIG